MNVTRRDFLKASTAIAVSLGMRVPGLERSGQAFARETRDGGIPVVWLEAQSCTGCSVSLLNTIYYHTIDALLLEHLDMEFHPALMAPAGNLSVSAAERAYRHGDYILVVEGSVPHAADGTYCYLWDGMTAVKAVERFSRRASFILAAGSCAAYGGMPGAGANPTDARGLEDEYHGKRVIKIPGCPTHPDWVVGTIAHIMANGEAPPLDLVGRPLEFFSKTVHSQCKYKDGWPDCTVLSEEGCLDELGCRGQDTNADCPVRGWNSPGQGVPGVNTCIGAGCPCIGCTEPSFPGNSRFYYVDA